MKTIILPALFLILISISGFSQSLDNQRFLIKPRIDSSQVKSDSGKIVFFNPVDSLISKVKISSNLSKRGDIIVFDPGPSGDHMPNAIVSTPGVHYHLNIIPYKVPPLKKNIQPWGKNLLPFKKDLLPWKKDSMSFGNLK